MYVDTASALRTIRDRQSVDAGRVTHEVAGVATGAGALGLAITRAVGQHNRAVNRTIGIDNRRELALMRDVGVRLIVICSTEDLNARRVANAFGQDRDSGAFVGAHQRGL